MARGAVHRLLGRVWADLGRDAAELERLGTVPEAPLPARLDVSSLAVGSVAAVALAAVVAGASRAPAFAGVERMPHPHLDGDRIATAFASDRVLLVDGERPNVWAPLSGFHRVRDGWVRTHGNYPHHAAALRRVLALPPDADTGTVEATFATRDAVELARDVTAAGGMCVVVSPEDPARDAALAATPLIDVDRRADAAPPRRRVAPGDPARPLAGVRVLDLTRVIAGPVATRTLALLGADVLRIDPRSPGEPPWQHLDTGAGKRSTLLDLRVADDAARFNALLGSADVVVLGYRPSALARLRIDPDSLLEHHPGLVIAQLSAWGVDGADADRGGFDSLVQAASGIALIEGAPDSPGALPVQALDHATGYLLAAAVLSMLERRDLEGGAWVGRMSLRRTAAELLTMSRTDDPTPGRALDEAAAAAHTETLGVGAGSVRIALPAFSLPGAPVRWAEPPHPWGSDSPDFRMNPGDTPGMRG